MVASATAWNLTGPTQALPTGQSSRSTVTQSGGTSTISESASQSQFTSKQNTPQFALESLEQLIAQLSDRPRLSNEEAAAQFPLAERIFSPRAGWGYDMGGGRVVFGPQAHAHAQRWNQEQLARREKAQRESGTIRGGTVATTEAGAQRTATYEALNRARQDYSKEAAFADASALAGRFTRELLETVMPNITKAVESSGTSGGAVAGLLAQDAAARTAEAQASLGLQTSVQYGQLANQISQILAQLSSALPPELQALVQALGVSKGTIDQGVSTATSTSNKTVQTEETKQAQDQVVQTGNPLATLIGGLRIGPSVATPTTAVSPVPNVIGATPQPLDRTLEQIVRRQSFGGSLLF
jgi:hypothetical protein